MAVDVSEMVPSTEVAQLEAPAAPTQETPAAASAATRFPVMTKEPTDPSQVAATESATEEEPDPHELIKKYPKLRDVINGTVGARVEQLRKQETEAEWARQERAAQTYQMEQNAAESRLRAQEDAYLHWLKVPSNDPNFEFEDKARAIYGRREGIDWQWQQAAAAEQQQTQAEAYRLDLLQSEDADEFAALPQELQQHFLTLPPDTFDARTKEAARKLYKAAVRSSREDYYRKQTATVAEEKVLARVKQELARRNIEAPDLDTGGGLPSNEMRYRTMEEAEAALRKGDISTRDLRVLRAQGLAYRRGF